MVKLLFNIKIPFFKILGIKNSPLNSNVAPRFKRQNMKKKKKKTQDSQKILESSPSHFLGNMNYLMAIRLGTD